MNIAVFGGSRGVGRLVIEQALAQGTTIQALVRTPENFDMVDDGLTVVPGDVLNFEDVVACVEGTDAVVCSLGPTSNNPDNIVSEGTQQIIAAMKSASIKRLVVVSSMGIGDSKDQISRAFKIIAKTVLKKAMQDKEMQEKLVRDSDLDWIIVRPAGLVDKPATGKFKAGLDKSIKAEQVSRADVAGFVLQQLTDNTYMHQTPAIS